LLPLQLAEAHLLINLDRYREALDTCQTYFASAQLDAETVAALQEVVASAQHGLGTFNHEAPQLLSDLWRSVLQSHHKLFRDDAAQSAYQILLSCSWRDCYWNLAQQVGSLLSVSDFHMLTGLAVFRIATTQSRLGAYALCMDRFHIPISNGTWL
jgi:hypothetical protein